MSVKNKTKLIYKDMITRIISADVLNLFGQRKYISFMSDCFME